jgi:hypothetical protein
MQPQVQLITENRSTGVIGARAIIVGDDPADTKNAIFMECGPEIGVIIARDRDGSEHPIGTIHQQEANYPHSDLQFTRVSYAFTITATARMTPDQRSAYLAVVMGGDEPEPAPKKKGPQLVAEDVKPAKKVAAKKPAKAMPVKPTTKKRR